MNDADKDTDTLVVECDLPDPPEKVWRALTEPDLVAQWLTTSPDQAAKPEVVEAEPNRLVRYRWRESRAEPDSIVSFELTHRIDGGTHLRLIHTALEVRSLRITSMLSSSAQYQFRRAA